MVIIREGEFCMYYFGKDFTKEAEIQSLLEDFLKKKQLEEQKGLKGLEISSQTLQTF